MVNMLHRKIRVNDGLDILIAEISRSQTKRQHKVTFLHDNVPSHTAKPVRDTLEALSLEILPLAAYSPDLAPSDYNLFASMGDALSEQFQFVRRCEKIAQRMVRSKRGRFLLA